MARKIVSNDSVNAKLIKRIHRTCERPYSDSVKVRIIAELLVCHTKLVQYRLGGTETDGSVIIDEPHKVVCEDCWGSGYSNHPDSGQVCARCNGQGDIIDEPTT